MRLIRSFILRLFIDSSAPDSLRGSLQDLSTSEIHTFTDPQILPSLLAQLASPAVEPAAPAGNDLHEPPSGART